MIHPFISGNKWRKLKYTLLKASAEGKKRLVTFGGVWSNHLLATACAAAKFGFRSTAFVRGEDISTDNLFLCRLFGMELKFTDRQSYRNKKELYLHWFSGNQESFFIDEGGAGEEGIKGCAELVDELTTIYDHIFCAAGTGTTAAGIVAGIERNSFPTRTHVVPVLKGADFIQNAICPAGTENVIFHCGYHFGGYAKTQPELLQFIKTFSSSTGILLDPVYTGKMMYGLIDLISKDAFEPGARILAVHTGGIFGLLGMKDRFPAQ